MVVVKKQKNHKRKQVRKGLAFITLFLSVFYTSSVSAQSGFGGSLTVPAWTRGVTVGDPAAGDRILGLSDNFDILFHTNGILRGRIFAEGGLAMVSPTTETIAAAATITADACGTLKPIDAASSVTTNTTNTFTNPTTVPGCTMDVCNVDAVDTITLDANANFQTISDADVALAPDQCVRVSNNGSVWYQVARESAPGGGGGDNITVNTTAATDADFNNTTPSAPTANDYNIFWQISGASPSSVSAYISTDVIGTTTWAPGSPFTWTFDDGATKTNSTLSFEDTFGNITWTNVGRFIVTTANGLFVSDPLEAHLTLDDTSSSATAHRVDLLSVCSSDAPGNEDCDYEVKQGIAGSLRTVAFYDADNSGNAIITFGNASVSDTVKLQTMANGDITLDANNTTFVVEDSVPNFQFITVSETVLFTISGTTAQWDLENVSDSTFSFINNNGTAVADVSIEGQIATGDDDGLNILQVFDNDTGTPSCSTLGSAGTFTFLDVDNTSTESIQVCNGTSNLVNLSTGALGTSKTVCAMLDAKGISAFATNGCTLGSKSGTNHEYASCDFATGTDNSGSYAYELADNLTGTTAQVTFIWQSTNAACNNGTDDDVCWTIDGDSVAADGAWDTATLGATLAAVTDRCTAQNTKLVTSPVTFTHSMVAGERAIVVIRRNVAGTDCGAAADDDYAQDAEFLAARFCYEIDNYYSGE